MRLWIAGLMILSALNGCAPAQPAPTPAPRPAAPGATVPSPTATPAPTSTPPTLPAAQAALFEALNQARLAERCPRLALDARLVDAAQAHAADIARRREASHRSADGSTLDQRLSRRGYQARRSAEVIAVSREAPTALVDAWMREPLDGRHRREIGNCLYQELGVGMAETESGIRYWVIVLGEPATGAP